MNKWFKLMLIIAFSFSLLSGCDNDDFAPYTNVDYDVSIPLESNIYVISEARQELTEIVNEYASDMPLTYAEYKIYSTKGTAEFEFFRSYTNGKNRAIWITLYVDLNTNTVTKISYEDGHGKRLASAMSTEIKQTENVNIMDVYKDEIAYRTLENNQYVNVRVIDEEVRTDIYEKTDKGSIRVTEEETTYILTDEDFVVKNKNSCIEFGESIDDLHVNEKLTYHRPLSEKRAYEIYKYENFCLSVALDDTIFSIVLFTSEFETARGIKVGDSIDKVFEKYGVTEKDDDSYYYRYQGPDSYRWIEFEVDENETITRIQLEAL